MPTVIEAPTELQGARQGQDILAMTKFCESRTLEAPVSVQSWDPQRLEKKESRRVCVHRLSHRPRSSISCWTAVVGHPLAISLTERPLANLKHAWEPVCCSSHRVDGW